MVGIKIEPEQIAVVAMSEALDALDHFKATGSREKFVEWEVKWRRTIDLLKFIDSINSHQVDQPS